MANVETFFADNKLQANIKQAERVFVKSYNGALDYHMFQSSGVLSDNKCMYPPECMEYGSLKVAMDWFKRQKREFDRYIKSSNVVARQLQMDDINQKKKRERFDGHDNMVHKRRFGGV